MPPPTSDSFVVRRAAPADVPAMCELSRRAILVSAVEQYTAAQLRAWAARRTVSMHEQMVRGTLALVAVDGETVAGFATLARSGLATLERGEVDQLYVDPDHGGRGVASRLLDEVEAAARRDGVTELVTHASWRAAPVFARCGYEPVEVETVAVQGVEITRLRMRKVLGC